LILSFFIIEFPGDAGIAGIWANNNLMDATNIYCRPVKIGI
jgi:hypothetical protein